MTVYIVRFDQDTIEARGPMVILGIFTSLPRAIEEAKKAPRAMDNKCGSTIHLYALDQAHAREIEIWNGYRDHREA